MSNSELGSGTRLFLVTETLSAPPFAPARRANARALVPIFDKVFAARPWAEWSKVFPE